MLPITDQSFSTVSKNLRILFTDLDDTLTTDGKLPKEAYSALWDLNNSGIDVVIITGRPSGWCDLIARLWPVKAVIGENGAFTFSVTNNKMHRAYYSEKEERDKQFKRIIKDLEIKVPGAKISADQNYREFDLAIDFAEEVDELSKADILKISNIMMEHGLHPKISSIHVNGIPEKISKLYGCENFLESEYSKTIEDMLEKVIFVGDSPNDEPMFKGFRYSCGVANIKNFINELETLPYFVASKNGGEGFAEIAAEILKSRELV